MENDPGRHGLRAGFDHAAEDHQRTRPVCPHALGEARSAEFLARVRHRLEALGWPQLTATFIGYLIVGRRP
jgi:hypothetical protein